MAARDPTFFKCILNQLSLDKIKISAGYVNYKKGKLPSSVTLLDKYENHWHVEVEKQESYFYFTKGWKEFADDNHLEVEDFIVFYSNELNVFNVVLFGKNSCEKEGVGGPKTMVAKGEGENEIEEQEDDHLEDIQQDSDEDVIEIFVNEEDNREISIVEIDDDDEDDDEEGNNVFNRETQNPMSGACGKTQIIKEEIQPEGMDVDEDEIRPVVEFDTKVQNPKSAASSRRKIIKEMQSEIIDVDEDETRLHTIKCNKEVKNPKSATSGRRKIIKEIQFEIIDVDEDETRHTVELNKEVKNPNSGASGKRKINKEIHSAQEQASAKKAGRDRKSIGAHVDSIFLQRNMSPPKNPYFVTKTRKERRNQMLIPSFLIKDYHLQLPNNMLLKDAEGRMWDTRLTIWEDGRIWYYGGWSDLCKKNSVEKDDLIACEFVKGKGKEELYIEVQIFRARDVDGV